MAVKQFAIPLDEKSIQTGDTNFKALVGNEAAVSFQLTHVTSGSGNQLNLITNKSGTPVSHTFTIAILNGTAYAELSASQMKTVFADAAGDDWDYVEAHWTVGTADTPDKSNLFMVQSGRTFDYAGWPPNSPSV
jgi:hypothetical protein